MPPACPSPPSYLDSAAFQSLAFHILTTIEIPIHLFAFYVIIFKTPTKMRSVKWAMFNLHFWSASLDISLSFLTIPYIFFPSTAGYGLGLLSWFDVYPGYQTGLVIAEIGMTVVSTLVLFENRYTILTLSDSTSTRYRRICIGFAYTFALLYIIPFIHQIPEQESAVETVLERLPSIRCFYSGPVFVVALDATRIALVTAGKLAVEFISILSLVALTSYKIFIQTQRSTLSQMTMSLQKRFFVALMIQTAIPIVIMIFPLIICANAVVMDYFNQAANNICFLIISSHGLVSTLAMLTIHKPYRDAIFAIFIKKTLRRNASESVFSTKLPGQVNNCI